MSVKDKCVVLFSGGTDSLCCAALCCEKYSEVHLLTFYEKSTVSSAIPTENVDRLRRRYPSVQIFHNLISTDFLIVPLVYQDFFWNLVKFHFFNLATPGISSLSWHFAAILYCKMNDVMNVHDGMTKELLHLPGHMPEIRDLFTKLYGEQNIHFSSPVLNWPVPEDQRFVNRLIVDRHGFALIPKSSVRTTGVWLFEAGILPHENVKGSEFDRRMQHDCYPFVVYNMLVFWMFEPLFGFSVFKDGLIRFMRSKVGLAREWLNRQERIDHFTSQLSANLESV